MKTRNILEVLIISIFVCCVLFPALKLLGLVSWGWGIIALPFILLGIGFIITVIAFAVANR